MTKVFHSSVKLKITVLVWLGSLVVLAAVLSYSYAQTRRIILAEAKEVALNVTAAAANKVEQDFRAVQKVALNLALTLQSCGTDSNELELLTLLRGAVQKNAEVFGAAAAFEPHAFKADLISFAPYYYKTPNGLAYEQLGSQSYNYFQKDWYHVPKILNKPIWAAPYFDEGGGNILMTTYSVPFYKRNEDQSSEERSTENFRGIVTADVSLAWLNQVVESIPVGQTGYCFIISDTGTFVAHKNPKLVMRESVFSVAEERKSQSWRDVGRAMIREAQGVVDLRDELGDAAYLAYARIPSPGWVVGAVFPKSELLFEVVNLHKATVVMAIGGSLLLLLASLLVARSIAAPLRDMAAATDRIASGDLDIDLSDIKSTDEVGQLAQALTHMAAGLKERDFIRDTFGRYLTKEVVNRLLESKDGLRLGGESRDISMIMSDLRGFTAMTSSMKPEQVITFLNRYLAKMVDILIEFRGTIDEIIGDGILAFFGAPEPLDDHPARAVACAIKMQLAMNEINRINESDGLPHLEMGIAVNTGKVVVGNIGSEKRSKYGAVGSQVNFTGRMESFTVGGQILVSKATYDRLADSLVVNKVLQVEMKGVPGLVELYDVRGIKGSYNLQLPDRYTERVPLEEGIAVQIDLLDQKTVSSVEATGRITSVSPTSAVLIMQHQIRQWDDLRLRLIRDVHQHIQGDVYAKAVEVSKTDQGYRVVVRFTSLSPEVYAIFREATMRGTPERSS
jgi:sigma-B regulation protein RsbU (phosphoserine phosphatase)